MTRTVSILLLLSSVSPAAEWWSLQPMEKYDVTGLSHSPNPVDSFIERTLAEKGLSPNAQADPRTLIRRITYDLTGLPPTPDEIDAFLANPDWEALVDRLLALPAFGEKFGQHWLDLARYADTHGYDKDKPRENAWPYRDYIIRSFNDDKPYSQFVQEQVAGDVLFPGTPDGVVALGFLAAGPWDFIGHYEVGEAKLDGRIAKHLDRDEMVSAVFNTFLSTTVQCAQCHDHEFDPISMQDYYRLHAVFSAVDRADRVYAGLPAAEEKRKNEMQSRANQLKAEKETLDTQIKRLLAGKVSGIDRRIAELKEKYGTGLKPQYGYHSLITKNAEEEKWVQLDLRKPRSITEVHIIPAYDKYAGIGGGFGFPIRYKVEVANDPEFTRGVRTLIDNTENDQSNPETRTIEISGDGIPFRYLRITATKLRERKNDYIFALGEVEAVNEGGADNFALGAEITAKDSIEQGVRWGKANLVDGIYFRELGNDAALAELRDLQKQRAAIETATRPPQTDKRLAEIQTELTGIEEQLREIPAGELVYAAATQFPRSGRFTATGGTPRPIHLLHRGDLNTPGDPMNPGAPPLWDGAPKLFFANDDWTEAEARAELTRYLTMPENPLVWRSIANRLWQWTFGQPLVGTPNDFGRGGMEPTHPELLDFLAVTLRDGPDQSLKSVLRLLFTSDAYRRSSGDCAENSAIDRGNAFLWRGNRRRLSAEEYRDTLLSVTGLLDREMGGSGFKDFIIEKPQHSPHYEYHLHDPNDPESHRRTVYRFVVRSQPQPMLTTLDCADPSISIPQRDESTTALQALTQWNHRFVEAMASRFAVPSVDDACLTVFGRLPTAEEKSVLEEHLQQEGPENLARVLFNMNALVYVD